LFKTAEESRDGGALRDQSNKMAACVTDCISSLLPRRIYKTSMPPLKIWLLYFSFSSKLANFVRVVLPWQSLELLLKLLLLILQS
jgi:hypothetical protein